MGFNVLGFLRVLSAANPPNALNSLEQAPRLREDPKHPWKTRENRHKTLVERVLVFCSERELDVFTTVIAVPSLVLLDIC